MIRINLLGTPKSKNKHSAASTVAAMDMGDVGSPAMKVAVAAALLVVFNLGYWYKLDREKQSIAAKMVVAEQKNQDRKSTRLNSSHRTISYAVFCLKKKK